MSDTQFYGLLLITLLAPGMSDKARTVMGLLLFLCLIATQAKGGQS